MEVLNTIQGAAVMHPTAWGWITLVIGLIAFVSLGTGASTEEGGIVGFGLVVSAIAIALVIWAPLQVPTGKYEPTKIEVKLTNPNFVIDATKYHIVEKRGEIYELEEIKQ